MSLLDRTPMKLPPRCCGLCRWWAPWIGQSDLLGTCGGAQFSACTDKFDTCDGFEMKADLKELLA